MKRCFNEKFHHTIYTGACDVHIYHKCAPFHAINILCSHAQRTTRYLKENMTLSSVLFLFLLFHSSMSTSLFLYNERVCVPQCKHNCFFITREILRCTSEKRGKNKRNFLLCGFGLRNEYVW